MSLPNTNTIIQPQNIYPDRFLVSYTYRTTGISDRGLFRSILSGQGFRGSNRSLVRSFEQEGYINPIRVCASFVPYRTPTAVFTAHFNALADIHDRSADYGDETTRAYLELHQRGEPELNWLHGDQVDDNIQQRIIGHLWERIILLETQILEIAHSLVRGGPFDRTAFLSAMKFALVELCVDLRTCDPHFCLRRIAPHFKLRFNRVVANRYGSSSHLDADALCDDNITNTRKGKNEPFPWNEDAHYRFEARLREWIRLERILITCGDLRLSDALLREYFVRELCMHVAKDMDLA
jgi:hypothetical protein